MWMLYDVNPNMVYWYVHAHIYGTFLENSIINNMCKKYTYNRRRLSSVSWKYRFVRETMGLHLSLLNFGD